MQKKRKISETVSILCTYITQVIGKFIANISENFKGRRLSIMHLYEGGNSLNFFQMCFFK
uniref:Uncharacterized protein n=1 Tax=Arundo donax TaxID=35708 RepID=A0A0A9QEE6_ARUDO